MFCEQDHQGIQNCPYSSQLEGWQTVDIRYLSTFNPIHETQVLSDKPIIF